MSSGRKEGRKGGRKSSIDQAKNKENEEGWFFIVDPEKKKTSL